MLLHGEFCDTQALDEPEHNHFAIDWPKRAQHSLNQSRIFLLLERLVRALAPFDSDQNRVHVEPFASGFSVLLKQHQTSNRSKPRPQFVGVARDCVLRKRSADGLLHSIFLRMSASTSVDEGPKTFEGLDD